MYANKQYIPGNNGKYTPREPLSGLSLEYSVEGAQSGHEGIILALTQVVQYGKMIERGEKPNIPDELVQKLYDLRHAVNALRKEVFERGTYPDLRRALPLAEKYMRMMLQYAQTLGLINTPEHDAARNLLRWLREKAVDPRTLIETPINA